MDDCLFCKILKGEIPSDKVFENDHVIGFKDIQPLAKEHYLFIHRNHSKNVNEMSRDDMAQVFDAIKEFTQSNELENNGFRVVSNINQHGCQSVFHTHFHVLGGEQLKGFGS
ncbi:MULTISPECIES: HIT domain-containing protein [Halobacteriovorax]|uniref:HIT domain-containing protein n=1 Tax=Halobacteriovorax vibrionivorans TaxID=2152716 RepID=A0ABY0IFR4_9BACT|nr:MULTISPECIES: HIT domain-containing protein [Halobacteriovorax]RZF21779.1 HIT domain-containing protein [Halobacteriovorax vibrionivorans]TGD48386.1 HIT domain-containing protein [Halobacteriovorax sp. Y22]